MRARTGHTGAMDFPQLPSGLIRARDVHDAGQKAALRAEILAGRMMKVRRGMYAPMLPPNTPSWLVDEQRHRNLVHATADAMVAPVFTGFSALALFGLPTYGLWPEEAFVMSTSRNGRRRPGVVAIAGSYAPETTVVGGRAVTSIEFTLIQVCRTGTLAAGLAAVDAALWVPRSGTREARTTLARLRAVHEQLLPYPGSRRPEAVLVRATTKSETVLETASRLVIEELGFEAPILQHRFWLPDLGTEAFVDFMWPSVAAVGEADGRKKYLGGIKPTARAGARSEDQAAELRADELAAVRVVDEKDRENAIRRQAAGFDRWDWGEMVRKTPIEQRLLRMSVPRTRPRRALIGPPDRPALRQKPAARTAEPR
jgi:hypothetical protein